MDRVFWWEHISRFSELQLFVRDSFQHGTSDQLIKLANPLLLFALYTPKRISAAENNLTGKTRAKKNIKFASELACSCAACFQICSTDRSHGSKPFILPPRKKFNRNGKKERKLREDAIFKEFGKHPFYLCWWCKQTGGVRQRERERERERESAAHRRRRVLMIDT